MPSRFTKIGLFGFAYENEHYFVHLYNRNSGLYNFETGVAYIQRKEGVLSDWIIDKFGAIDIEENDLEVGEVIAGVWRPGLFHLDQSLQALGTDEYEQRSSEKTLRMLVDKLDEVLAFIEPSETGFSAYGHKTRELLILACTEVESYWLKYMAIANAEPSGRRFNTEDYVKLAKPLYLAEFEVNLRPFITIEPITPFADWDPDRATQSLPWYDAYNQTKHDRNTNFNKATLERCIESVCAVLVMYCVRYGPHSLFNDWISIPALYKALFEMNLKMPDRREFYIPVVDLDLEDVDEVRKWGIQNRTMPWRPRPLTI